MTVAGHAHLLLVDDDPGLLKLLGLRLTSEGYSVVTAESGAEGLRVLNREKVDLVISDLRMDEMDGMQLFAEIQKVNPGMPVIILTAHGSIPDASCRARATRAALRRLEPERHAGSCRAAWKTRQASHKRDADTDPRVCPRDVGTPRSLPGHRPRTDHWPGVSGAVSDRLR